MHRYASAFRRMRATTLLWLSVATGCTPAVNWHDTRRIPGYVVPARSAYISWKPTSNISIGSSSPETGFGKQPIC